MIDPPMTPFRRAGSDRGANFVEYGAVILLVAALVAVTVTAGYGREVAGMIRTAIDCAAQADACPTGGSASPAEESSKSPEDPPAPALPGGEAGVPDPPTAGDGFRAPASSVRACGSREATWPRAPSRALAISAAISTSATPRTSGRRGRRPGTASGTRSPAPSER